MSAQSKTTEPPTEEQPPTGGREDLSFGQAIEELEAILRRIEGEEVDIDRLAAEVARAGELADVCRAKLRKAELQVTEVVQKLDPDDD